VPRTVRVQLTIAVTAVVALVVALSGLFVVLRADHHDRAEVDRTLAVRAAQVRTAAAKSGSLPTDGTYAIRLIDGTGVRAERGSTTKFSLPVKDGYSTVTAADGTHWRSWAETLKTGAQMQILINLAEVEQQHSGNVRIMDILVLLAALVAGLGTWLVGGLVLRPLQRLAAGAQALSPDDPEGRLPEVTGPPEVAELGTAINGALDRMTARADRVHADEDLAADVSKQLRDPLARLGEELDELLDNPDMPATQRHLILAAIQTEHRRIVTLADDLEARARGEASR
jgi:signal transduction histidine kinase